MKKLTLICILCSMAMALLAQTAIPPSSGIGTVASPYQISSLENLAWIAQNPQIWSSHFRQSADIFAMETATWPGGWAPIGTLSSPFTGAYDGAGFQIEFLIIDRAEEQQGLFGVTSSTAHLSNITIQNAFVTGYSFVGALVGLNYGTIHNCHVNASLSVPFTGAGNYFGIITGFNEGTITRCRSYGEVSNPGGQNLGGLAGTNYGDISDSFSRVSVLGANYLGGFTGNNHGDISRCYSTGGITSTAGSNIGGFMALNYGTYSANFWDMESSGILQSEGATGCFSSEMQDSELYLLAGWDFVGESLNGSEDIWELDGFSNDAYPFHRVLSFLLPPRILGIEIQGNHVLLTWQEVPGATGYQVYSSDNPSTGFAADTSGNYHNLSWSAPLQNKRFYHIVSLGD